jgi:hypothetical protein
MDKTERELRDMLEDRRLVRWPTEPQWVAIWTAANVKGYKGTVSAAVFGVAPDLLDVDWVGLMKNDPESARMMWSEIRMRRSVAPFRRGRAPTPIYNPDASDEAAGALQQQISDLVSRRWEVISDGPSGVQLRAPKKLKLIDLICLIVGVPALILFHWIGLVPIALGLIDYFVFTKVETKFLPRP